jgi:biopolymer transport protein ExbD
MRPLIKTLFVLAACLLAAVSYQVQAKYSLELIEGTAISAQAGTLVVKDEENKDHAHAVDSSAQILVEGKMSQLEDVRTGMKANVTLDAGKVIAVSATKPTRFALLSH